MKIDSTGRQSDAGRREADRPGDDAIPAWSESRPDNVAADADDHPRRQPSTPDAARTGETGGGDRTDPEQRAAAADRPARSRRKWPALVAVLLLAIGGFYAYRHFGAGAAKPSAAGGQSAGVPVQAVAAETSDVPIYLESLGTVQALNTVTIRSRVEGQIVKIGFVEGQMVKRGDLIAQIDPRPYQAALDQAVAKKAQDEATLANTKLDLQRTQNLGEYATRQQLDTQRAGVGSQTAQIAYDEATIENARTQLDYATIRSPITGRTGIRQIDEGNIVHPTDTTGIVEITQIEPIAVLFTAPEQQLPQIGRAKGEGMVAVRASSSDGKTVLGEGELVLINNQVDAASGTVKLKAQFANAQDRLWPGLSVNTRLKLRTLNGVVTVPSTAVQRGPDQLFVFVVKPDSSAEKRVVKVALFSEDRAVIEDGLRAGEKVVTGGQYRVVPGGKLAVAPATPDGAEPGPKPEQTAAN